MAKRTEDFYQRYTKPQRKFPFTSLAQADQFRDEIHPHFSSMTIRENGDRRVGFWDNSEGTFHIFTDSEIDLLIRFNIKRREATYTIRKLLDF